MRWRRRLNLRYALFSILNFSIAVMSRRYSPPHYSPLRRGYGGRGRSPPPPPRRGYDGGGGLKGHGSLLV
ncbi:unnamed protein product [Brassica rapa]|uniref:Uncharacterized protein n=2 Tax=Brassica TaxID=3705 RepID=A0A8D9DI68_BRACM|nr:unnamed protein product [Brassica napus]CAG7874848.1 unnamed protein product [Brassica rapa]